VSNARRAGRAPEAESDQPVPVIALVGRPNVGKSTLFNRLTRSRQAIVADIPGLTRDRHYAPCSRGDRRYVLIDTGGFEPVSATGVSAQMARQTRQAIIEADLVIFVVDGRQGMTPRDQDIANELRRSARLVRVAVNKSEGLSQAVAGAEFHGLGLGAPSAISSAHGEGVGELIDDCLDALDEARESAAPAAGVSSSSPAAAGPAAAPAAVEPAAPAGAALEDAPGAASAGSPEARPDAAADEQAEAGRRPIRVAVVGRPNSGKSTLINALLGEERLIAFDTPGTTRDSIAVDFEFEKRKFTMIDTAGIRRRGKVHEVIEKFSVVKTLQAIEDCNVCILLIDAVDGVSEQDGSIASYILDSGRALVIALNKWDAVPADDQAWVKQEFARKLHFLSFARMHPISALKRKGLRMLMRSVTSAHVAATSNLSTPKLTRYLLAAVQHQAPPRSGPVRPKMRYAHQGGQNPPIIVIHGSALDKVSESYKRYLEGWFRERLGLEGTPLRIELRSGANPFAPKTPR
jgi:GTP-binding protein